MTDIASWPGKLLKASGKDFSVFGGRKPQDLIRSQVCGGEAPNRLTTCLTASRASASTGKMRDMVLARRCV